MQRSLGIFSTKFTPKNKGFTLVEMLVLIAIISILASLLMPALNSAQESARTITCLANLKQVAIASSAYCSDNAGLLPIYSRPDGMSAWGYYLSPQDSVRMNLFCPQMSGITQSTMLSDNKQQWMWYTYGIYHPELWSSTRYNARKATEGSYLTYFNKGDNSTEWVLLNFNKMKRPSQIYIYADTQTISGAVPSLKGCWYFNPADPNHPVSIHHGYNSNFAYADGHVKSIGEGNLRVDEFSRIMINGIVY